MQVTVEAYYKDKIQKVQQELDAARDQLKHQKELTSKAKKQLHHKISKLYEELRDWKYRASYLYPPLLT